MKKLAMTFAVAFALSGLGAAAHAETVCVPLSCITANGGGYLLSVDGDAANPDPLDGYISVSSGGQLCADDNGQPGQSDSPTCAP